jgi:hypothetical protein
MRCQELRRIRAWVGLQNMSLVIYHISWSGAAAECTYINDHTYDTPYPERAFSSNLPQIVVHEGQDGLNLTISNSRVQDMLWTMFRFPTDLLGMPGGVGRAAQHVSIVVHKTRHVSILTFHRSCPILKI